MRILGIETSCDETGVAIYDDARGIVAEALFSQVDLHAQWGGVVPELASRDHVRRLLPLLAEVLHSAGLKGADLDGVAYTAGPGLAGALLVGASTAKALAMAWRIPALGIHHMEGHLLAPLLGDDPPAFPFTALLVSGGHTQLLSVRALGDYELLGETLDDAAGEAFDKAAKMMGLGYPGGPRIAELAQRGRAGRFRFPRPMTDRPGLDFSFSGLKTYCLNTVRDCGGATAIGDEDRADIARAFEEAVVETLLIKCRRAMAHTGHDVLVMAGGVSANQHLRQRLSESLAGVRVCFPPQALCTDNGAMIAFAGALRMAAGQHDDDLAIGVRPRWPLSVLAPPGQSVAGSHTNA